MQKYELIEYVNGCVVKRVIGSKRKCINEMVSLGVPYRNFLGIKKKPDRFAKKRVSDLLGYSVTDSMIMNDNGEIVVVEFELVGDSGISGKESKRYFLSPFIFLAKRTNYKIDRNIIKPEKHLIIREEKNLIEDVCYSIPTKFDCRSGWRIQGMSEDLLLGRLPIRCELDKIKDFVKLDTFAKPCWYIFLFDKRYIFGKYVNMF